VKHVYVDSSVILRMLFGEPSPLAEWSKITEAYTSRLTRVEVLRVLDRKRLVGDIGDEDVAQAVEQFDLLLESLAVMPCSERVFARAEGPMMTVVMTLDAIHVVSALEISKQVKSQVTVATHDAQQGRAARALGLQVIGC
jgi:predicted nucleic acid-binding protein